MDHRRNHRGCTVGDCLVVVNRGGAAPNFRVSMDHWRSRGGWWLAGMDGVDSAGADDFGGFVGEYPQPQIHHSEWMDPYQRQQGQSSGSSNTFNFSEMQATMESIFGPQQSCYY
ncbi:hypothetical protein E3N88_37515 [Mikania micrantha]|uniref:Uncharacterized protein n=1 Tax=Mikania micrantha TaxID=192012 RepID=A0A5N6LRE1_9ASTR|nr:hypothetical protein E3N88_37515 [Mikania micrantha]